MNVEVALVVPCILSGMHPTLVAWCSPFYGVFTLLSSRRCVVFAANLCLLFQAWWGVLGERALSFPRTFKQIGRSAPGGGVEEVRAVEVMKPAKC